MLRLALTLLLIFSLAEISLWINIFWRWRKYFSSLIVLGLLVSSVLLLFAKFDAWSVLVLYFSIYRIVNLLRVVKGRTKADYLYNVAIRSSFYLIMLQVTTLLLELLSDHYNLKTKLWLAVIAVIGLISGLLIAQSSQRSLKKTSPKRLESFYAQADLPNLTVAIPARNETVDLQECLTTLVNSEYSKLEIIVLDDCSQNKHTPLIIKDFAQKGVRFLAGDVPPEYWNAKTFAYKQLAEQANGDLILFCGVDTRFANNSLTLMVETLLKRKKSMISFMPVNKRSTTFSLRSYLIQPGRYIWELALPRKLIKRPPVLSTCWIITSELLKSAGGFEAVARSASVESYFAKKAVQANDGYSFIRSEDYYGLTSLKSPSEQRATAIRTRYPQMHRRPELVALISLYELVILLVPFGLLVVALLANNLWLRLCSLINIIILLIIYTVFVRTTFNKKVPIIFILMPLAAIYDIYLLNYSMFQYEFRDVIWKGRNVCLPVMYASKTDTITTLN